MRLIKLMISVVLISLLMVINLTAGNGITNSVQKSNVKTVPGQFVVKFKVPAGNGAQVAFSKLSSVAAKYNTTSNKQIFAEAKNVKIKNKLNLGNVYLFETDKGKDIQQIVNELNRDPSIEYAEPVYLSKLEAEPDDPLYTDQYHLPQIKAPEAWDITFGSMDVIIGVIDSGVDWDHEDLADNIWQNTGEIPDNGLDDDGNGFIDDIRGWDFVTGVSGTEPTQANPNEDGEIPDNDPMDFGGHGTHVAGISGAVTNNSTGVASASAGAQIMPLRIGWKGNDGTGWVNSGFAAEAYIYAADNGAHITNQSSGNSGQAIIDAAYYAFLNGVLIVESAGNGDAVTPSSLGAQDWVISVGSVNQNDEKTYYSSYGEYVKVSAPGGEMYVGNDTYGILSTALNPSDFYGGAKYIKLQGTSMAAPLVASAAALIKSNNPALTVVDLFSRVVGTADNIDAINPDYAGLLGSGRINLQRALTEVVNADPKFNIVASEIDDASGNGNNVLDPGEQVELKITLRNSWDNASNVSVELSGGTAWPVSVVSGISNLGNVTGVLDTTSWEAEASFTISAAADAIPLSNQFELLITADGFTQTLNYTIAISPQVLFVADFAENNDKYLDFSSFYIDAFESNGISYDYVHHMDVDVTSELLNKYSIVVWGCEWFFDSVDSLDRLAISSFLDNGGSLFISGQDVGWDLNESADNVDIDFFNNYLKANYVADDAGVSEIFGVENDPITAWMDIDFYQTKRAITEQFPDVLEPIGGAVSMLNYKNGASGAIRYSGDYNLVYFGFGGFEAVTDENTRDDLMKNIIDWLSGFEYWLEELNDTETTTGTYEVNFGVESLSSTISDVQLYWDTDGELPYNKLAMTDLGDGNYMAEIPAQPSGSEVDYFAYAESDNGSYVIATGYQFNVGPDNIPPEINLVSNPLTNSINIYGPAPYGLMLSLDDNIGIDDATAMIYYSVNDFTPFESNLLEYFPDEGLYTGSFEFSEALQVGDKVSYYFTAKDVSANANETTTEVYEYFIDTLQLIDDFEKELSEWDLEGDWGLSTRHKSGEFSLSDSPDGFYESNLDIAATYRMPFNLTPYKHAVINFFMRANIERNKDSLFVDVSTDGGNNWNKEFGYSASSTSFKPQTVDLTNYTGVGNDAVMIRFRMMTDESGERDGVWIDDVDIVVSYNVVGVEDEIISIPEKFALSQNYPNPFNPSTMINYNLKVKSDVTIKVFDVLGREVATLVNENKPAGSYEINFDASKLTSSVYFYSINAKGINGENFSKTMKMLLLR